MKAKMKYEMKIENFFVAISHSVSNEFYEILLKNGK